MNLLLWLVIIIVAVCVVHGANVGMLRIIYGLVAWIFVFWFVTFSSPYIQDYLIENTSIQKTVEEKITNKLYTKYEKAEDEEEGKGQKELFDLLPKKYKENVDLAVQGAVDALINKLADYFTGLVIQIIAVTIAVVLSIIITAIVGAVINTVGVFPLIKGTNRIFGALAGVLEALLIIWIIMFVADFFPSSGLGRFIISNCQEDEMLMYIYNHNIISLFI